MGKFVGFMNYLKEQMCKSNFFYFCKLILDWEYMGRMHREIIDKVMNSDNHLVVLAPRGHWKTSLMSVAFPLWIAYRNIGIESKEIVNPVNRFVIEFLVLTSEPLSSMSFNIFANPISTFII